MTNRWSAGYLWLERHGHWPIRGRGQLIEEGWQVRPRDPAFNVRIWILMLIPIGRFESPTLKERVRRLEHALALSLSALQTLAEGLQSKFGTDFLGPDLKHLVADNTEAESVGVIEVIDCLVREGQHPAATSHLRKHFGVTWDEAHLLIGEWATHSAREKLRWLRLVRFIKALESQHSRTV